MCNRFIFSILIFALLIGGNLSAQDADNTVNAPKAHSPHKATLYSMALPGLGQAYNKKYWKIPIVYAGIGTIGYFALSNRSKYLEAKEAYIYVFNGEDYPIDNDLIGKYEADDLREIRDYYRRNMELSWILMGLWYVLNVVDATVDAHLFDYDIGDDLKVHLSPVINMPQPMASNPSPGLQMTAGIGIKLKF